MLSLKDLLNPIKEPEQPKQQEQLGSPNKEDQPKKCENCSRPAAANQCRCEECAAINARRTREMFDGRKQQGKCGVCGEKLDRVGVRCKKCNDRKNMRQREWKKKKREEKKKK
ncbi:hypothetical protein FPOA_00225 [Fusarium poae]|uniref:Uncharacterized protein n=1 Tax=Fusarium poae TaxID=36050 RepID=A0A1B8B0L0_FUSPO|nr:hypothetical protein FPOA_00225 [Fusarium poae]